MDYAGGGGTPSAGGFQSGSGYGSSSGGGGTKARRSYDEQTMVPVTICMCQGAVDQDGSVSLPDGRGLYHVRLVAAVRSVEDFSTNCVYTVEDGTGTIEVKQWADDNDCTAVAQMRQKTLKDHIYVKVVGQIKIYDGKKMIVAESVKPINGNELTHHMLEVVYAGQLHQHKDRIVAPVMPVAAAQPMAISSSSNGGGEWQQRLLEFIQNSPLEQGVSVQECVAATGCTENQVRGAINHWSDEGSLYTTIDDHHYKYA